MDTNKLNDGRSNDTMITKERLLTTRLRQNNDYVIGKRQQTFQSYNDPETSQDYTRSVRGELWQSKEGVCVWVGVRRILITDYNCYKFTLKDKLDKDCS